MNSERQTKAARPGQQPETRRFARHTITTLDAARSANGVTIRLLQFNSLLVR
jgi:hypothetical protein